MISLLCSALLMGYFTYYYMPPLNLSYLAVYAVVLIGLIPVSLYYSSKQKSLVATVHICLAVLVGLMAAITSAPILHSTAYRSLLGDVHTQNYKTSLPPIDIKNAPLVSRHMANQVAQKQLSDIPALGSIFEVGDLVKQNVNGKLYWVAFLEFRGFWQWYQGSGSPGYIKVSATDSSDVQLVTELKGEKINMPYLSSSFMSSFASRKIYLSNKTVGLVSPIPELDDEGRPYLVSSIYENKVGFAGADATGVSILDTQTGEVKTYSMEDVPAWVDWVHPTEMIAEQVLDWGNYVNGWLNPSQKGRLTISDHVDLVYGEDGSCYFYVGIASVGRDNGIVGFMLINSRTKHSELFYVSGASEYVAASSAEGVMPEKKYHATNPLPFNVNGEPTYLLTLTDDNGLPRAYGMVNIENYQILAVADTLANAYQLYQNKLSHHSSNNIIEDKELVKVSDEVERISAEIKAGNTVYYIKFRKSDQLFTVTSDVNEEIVLTTIGDKVDISYPKSTFKTINLVSFDNLMFKNKEE